MGKYDDIIHLEHPTSLKHPRMSQVDRAAQFSPFAALTGHEEAIEETARRTTEKIELSDEDKARLDRNYQWFKQNIASHPVVSVTYFVPDEHKQGGRYLQMTGELKKVDEYKRTLIFMNGTTISLEDVLELE